MFRTRTQSARHLGWLTLALSIIGTTPALAERPTAPRLVPESTVGYVRIASVSELQEMTRKSSVGRMLEDEQLKPLVGDLYNIVEQLFQQVGDRLGLTLEELTTLAQGEVAIAIIPTEAPSESNDQQSTTRENSPEAIRARIEARRNRLPVGVVLIVETGDRTPVMRKIFQIAEEQAINRIERSVKTVTGVDVITYTQGNQPPFSYAEKENTFIMGIGPGMVDDVLKKWKENSSTGTLAQNTDFGNVMSHCVGAEETRPQITFFADPYTLVERLIKTAGGPAAVVWPILENLEIDKIKGIGGSSFSGGEDEFEGIVHVHVLLETPRDGILSVVRPGEGSTQPEDWVPEDIVSYATFHWNILKTYEGLGRIVGRFQSADFLEQRVEEPLKERTEIDLKADILEQVTGRVSTLRWNEPPIRINSATQVWAIEVKDIAKAQATLDKLKDSFDNTLEKGSYGGQVVYAISSPNENQNGNFPENFRRQEPTLALIGNCVVASDSRKAVEHVIDTLEGRQPRLSASPDYDLIAGEISGKLDSKKPFLFSYLRGEEAIRPIYELVRDPRNREFLRGPAENNPFVKMLLEALEKNELPAFSAFSKYFAPSGGFAYDDPTGVHYATFTLKPLE